jgi:transposase
MNSLKNDIRRLIFDGSLWMKSDLSKMNLKPCNLEEALEVINQLAGIIIELKKDNDLLREKLNNNSKNSSLPPSQDLKKKKKMHPKSGRKPGGQPGHKASQKIIVPLEQVNTIIDCKPSETCDCGGKIRLKDKIEKHQVFDIPVANFETTEYRIYGGFCTLCHIYHKGKLPNGVSKKGFGPRAQGMTSLLTSKYRLSKRLVQSWFHDVYKMPMCVGSVSNIEHTVSKALEPIHQEIQTLVQHEKIINIDETGYKKCHKSAWAWIMSSSQYTCFILNKSRGRKVAKELIGNFHGRMVITDRYSAYNYLPDDNHQICWAHLKRDFKKIAERPGEAGKIGNKLLVAYEKLFVFWKTEHRIELTSSKKQRQRLRYFKNKMLKWLRIGAYCGHDKTARTCENILDFSKCLWHFFEMKNVSPTNNHAEQQLRPLVISKKLTFGTQSERGSRYIERIFTIVTTCKQQGRDILLFLVEAVEKYFLGEKSQFLTIASVQ